MPSYMLVGKSSQLCNIQFCCHYIIINRLSSVMTHQYSPACLLIHLHSKPVIADTVIAKFLKQPTKSPEPNKSPGRSNIQRKIRYPGIADRFSEISARARLKGIPCHTSNFEFQITCHTAQTAHTASTLLNKSTRMLSSLVFSF